MPNPPAPRSRTKKAAPGEPVRAAPPGPPHHALPGGLDDGRMSELLGYKIAQAAIPSFKIFDKHIGKPLQLRRVDFTILMLVAANKQVTQRQLCQALAVSAPRLTIVCDQLVERSFITRTRSEADRRQQYIALTRKGAALVRQADLIANSMELELLGHLTSVERTLLFDLLEKVAIHRRV